MNDGLVVDYMDPLLISIYKIKDIESISLNDLVLSGNNGKMNIIANLIVTYDGGKVINLCSKDKYFDIFVKKVFEVYSLEKDKVIVDSRFDPFQKSTCIKIDDYTKRVLESGDLTRINEIYGFYNDKKSYNDSLLFQSDEVKLYLPIMKYHLKQLFGYLNISLNFNEEDISGYRNNYVMNYKIDGIDDILLINLKSFNNNEMNLFFRSKDKRFDPISIKVQFNKKSIITQMEISKYDLYCEDKYSINDDNTITRSFSIYKDGLLIVYKNELLEKVENPLLNVSGIDSHDDLIYFKLPWNSFYGVKNRREVLNETEEIIMTNNKYLSVINDEFMLREYASKEYHRKKSFNANESVVVMDEVGKRIYGILLDRDEKIYLLETYFEDNYGSSGYYETHLKNKYYYHITKSMDGLIGLEKNKLIPLSNRDDIIKSADLLNKDEIKRVLGR